MLVSFGGVLQKQILQPCFHQQLWNLQLRQQLNLSASGMGSGEVAPATFTILSLENSVILMLMMGEYYQRVVAYRLDFAIQTKSTRLMDVTNLVVYFTKVVAAPPHRMHLHIARPSRACPLRVQLLNPRMSHQYFVNGRTSIMEVLVMDLIEFLARTACSMLVNQGSAVNVKQRLLKNVMLIA